MEYSNYVSQHHKHFLIAGITLIVIGAILSVVMIIVASSWLNIERQDVARFRPSSCFVVDLVTRKDSISWTVEFTVDDNKYVANISISVSMDSTAISTYSQRYPVNATARCFYNHKDFTNVRWIKPDSMASSAVTLLLGLAAAIVLAIGIALIGHDLYVRKRYIANVLAVTSFKQESKIRDSSATVALHTNVPSITLNNSYDIRTSQQ